MQIEHVGLWANDIEKMREFYVTFFDASASALYHNSKTGFRSYFLHFEEGARLELMQRKDIGQQDTEGEILGYAHLAISLGSKEKVDTLTETLVEHGYALLSPTRTTGDGYYESVITDPESNRIELTI